MSAYLSLITLSLLTVRADYVGHSVAGEVEQGNYTYYTLKQPGHLRLTLTSHQGDADLYVAGAELERPTFYFEEHELSSTTCGVDTVLITPGLTRPIHIGVYGHPNYVTSRFRLEVLIEEEKNETDFFYDNVADSDYVNDRDDHEPVDKTEEEEESFWKQGNSSTLKMIFSILGSILEILLEVLI